MTDYSEEFDRLRRNRVELSHIKYGSARINFGGGRVDALKTAEDCLEAFKRDKNTEHLVDAANYLMFRFIRMRRNTPCFSYGDISRSPFV